MYNYLSLFKKKGIHGYEFMTTRVLVTFFLGFFISGCSMHQKIEQQTYRSCEMNCQQQLNHCQKKCTDNCQICELNARKSAAKAYKQYRRERCIEGKTMILRLQSYHDPLQCRKTTCNCPADYQVCVEACRGKIHKRLQVEKTCC